MLTCLRNCPTSEEPPSTACSPSSIMLPPRFLSFSVTEKPLWLMPVRIPCATKWSHVRDAVMRLTTYPTCVTPVNNSCSLFLKSIYKCPNIIKSPDISGAVLTITVMLRMSSGRFQSKLRPWNRMPSEDCATIEVQANPADVLVVLGCPPPIWICIM